MRKHNRQVTLRIPEDLLQQIIKASASLQENKSRFIKRSLIAYLTYYQNVAAPILQRRDESKITRSK